MPSVDLIRLSIVSEPTMHEAGTDARLKIQAWQFGWPNCPQGDYISMTIAEVEEEAFVPQLARLMASESRLAAWVAQFHGHSTLVLDRAFAPGASPASIARYVQSVPFEARLEAGSGRADRRVCHIKGQCSLLALRANLQAHHLQNTTTVKQQQRHNRL